MDTKQREAQIAEAEAILGARAEASSFAKGLFFGEYRDHLLPPYRDPYNDPEVAELVSSLRAFCQQHIDPVAIDRKSEIPGEVIRGLGELGVLGACLPQQCGGMNLSQTQYCQLLEVLGGHCGSTALFVNAHHSIGPRALVLFGTPEQQQRWLPKLASGEWISAFALTEPQAGSDAANVQTTATPAPDGKGFVLNGEKQWITNGSLAQVLTVMARTPEAAAKNVRGSVAPGSGGRSAITAFLVTPDMPGFEVAEARMDKCGVRGTATSRLKFHDMYVPRENVLGPLGKGLRVALTVLDYGRTTFGASCTGAAKFCLARACEHVKKRVQFGQPLAEFELVQQKIARMQAGVLAMQACTYQTAELMDAAKSDFMVETAMLKVFATETLWQIVYDTFQLFGGRAYFTDEPYERMMRDARINMIGEGANDVLRVFTALVGMRDVGLELQGVLQAIQQPVGNLGRLGKFLGRTVGSLLVGPEVITSHSELQPQCNQLAHDVASLGQNVARLLRTHRESIVDRQCQVARIGDAATELYVSSCVLRHLDAELRHATHHGSDGSEVERTLATGRYYLRAASRRIRHHLARIWDNDDAEMLELARRTLNQDSFR